MCMNGGSAGQEGCIGEDFQQKKCNTQQCDVESIGEYYTKIFCALQILSVLLR